MNSLIIAFQCAMAAITILAVDDRGIRMVCILLIILIGDVKRLAWKDNPQQKARGKGR